MLDTYNSVMGTAFQRYCSGQLTYRQYVALRELHTLGIDVSDYIPLEITCRCKCSYCEYKRTHLDE
jgi:hypothetical protein